ncbi:MAG: hypothetical protein BWK76_01295 [Desulfobulbaceae bacterium A2]|nr:MAG: hypothetical protein BWK76_01295 [Desulfobulbaceae bacterium A2]
MYRLLLGLLLCLALGVLSAGPCRTAAGDEAQSYPLPLAEMTRLVGNWLAGQGLPVERSQPAPDQVQLQANNDQGQWVILLEPHSALSTLVRVSYHAQDGGTSPAPADLAAYLRHYPKETPAVSPFPAKAPPEVMQGVAATVCLRTVAAEPAQEITGFVIDAKLILSTAHGLSEQVAIRGTTTEGKAFTGTVLKLDRERDLALIGSDMAHDGSIAVHGGKNILDDNERVYATGCPANLRGVVYRGAIVAEPRRIGPHPYWQVRMEVHPGSSGSPVFDAQGALVAMLMGRYRGTDSTGFLIPLETIMDFLREHLRQCNTEDTK